MLIGEACEQKAASLAVLLTDAHTARDFCADFVGDKYLA
jgi:hypothetical protein